MRGLEEAVAAAGRQAAAAGALARETSAALRVLEWRVDQVGCRALCPGNVPGRLGGGRGAVGVGGGEERGFCYSE